MFADIETKNSCLKFLLAWWKIYGDDFDRYLPRQSSSSWLNRSSWILKWKTDVSGMFLSCRRFMTMILIILAIFVILLKKIHLFGDNGGFLRRNQTRS